MLVLLFEILACRCYTCATAKQKLKDLSFRKIWLAPFTALAQGQSALSLTTYDVVFSIGGGVSDITR